MIKRIIEKLLSVLFPINNTYLSDDYVLPVDENKEWFMKYFPEVK
jgi:hypothetical protein